MRSDRKKKCAGMEGTRRFCGEHRNMLGNRCWLCTSNRQPSIREIRYNTERARAHTSTGNYKLRHFHLSFRLFLVPFSPRLCVRLLFSTFLSAEELSQASLVRVRFSARRAHRQHTNTRSAEDLCADECKCTVYVNEIHWMELNGTKGIESML